eukprot:TRINITY_DN2170_c0_g1_i2.p2 TRINITY_DN2170_c0_g1~~TRINITY_DN2170_c0_g1_i2.p2  ORF type:complete len:390 (-),score=80.54 TRINITY_DN2170_c0_g1_i2:135-1304(-)
MEPLPEKDEETPQNNNISIPISPRSTEKTKSAPPRKSGLRSSIESMYAEAILNLKASTSNSDREKLKIALQTIKMYIDNIVKDPKNEKFRNINKNFKAFREKINTLPGVTSLLYLIGFSENGDTLTLAEPDEPGVSNLQFLSAELAKHTAVEPEPKNVVYNAGDGELLDSNFTLDILGNQVPVLPLLRGRQWKAINTAVTIPLMEASGDTMNKHLPVVTFGHVFPPRVSYMRKEGLALIGKTVKELEKVALKNLKEVKYSWKANEFQVNDVKLPTLVCNEHFSAEKILDSEFLMEAESLLVKTHASIFGMGTEDSIAVIIPCVGALVAMKFDMSLIPYLRGLSQALYDQAEEPHKLTSAVFTVLAGRIIGRVSFKDENIEDLENLNLSD